MTTKERVILDTPINTPETSEAAALYYGAILHPTIEDISVMVINF